MKKNIFYRKVESLSLFFAIAFFCILFSLPMLTSQNYSAIQSNQKLKKGERLQIAFESHREDGVKDTGRWINTAVDENTIEVDFMVENTSNLNPYQSKYNYLIELLGEGAFQVEMMAALDPKTLRLSDDFTIEYQGDAIYFPANLVENFSLPSAKGIFSVIQSDGSKLLDYQVEITNRKIQLADVNQIEGKVYQHTYDFHFKNIINGEILVMDSEEQITELLSPYLGMLQQERTSQQNINTSEKRPTAANKRLKQQNSIKIKSIAIK